MTQDPVPPAERLPLRSRLIGLMLVVVGVPLMFIALGVGAEAFTTLLGVGLESGDERALAERLWPDATLLTLAGAALGTVGALSTAIGARLRQPDAIQLVAQDDRPIVLYLRTFAADEHLAAKSQSMFVRSLSLEERLVRELHELGPVIALGDPRFGLLRLGAGRVVADDDEWQDAVTELGVNAGWVIFYASDSPSLAWELELVTSTKDLRQVLVFFGGSRDTYQRFGRLWSAATGTEWPAPPRGTVGGLSRWRTLVGVIAFTSSGEAFVEGFANAGYRRSIRRAVRRAMSRRDAGSSSRP